jgi:ABC-type multidrug transport system ATPase subunit
VSGERAPELARQSAALWVEALDKVYADGTRALVELSLRVPAGCFYGLLGPNGSGKTTLLGMISGLVRAPAGRILVFGHDAVADYRRARLLLGLAPQEVHLDRFSPPGACWPTTGALRHAQARGRAAGGRAPGGVRPHRQGGHAAQPAGARAMPT